MCKVALEVGEGWYHVYGVKGIVKNVAGRGWRERGCRAVAMRSLAPKARRLRFLAAFTASSSLCPLQACSALKSLSAMDSSRRADARRLDSCDEHRNEGGERLARFPAEKRTPKTRQARRGGRAWYGCHAAGSEVELVGLWNEAVAAFVNFRIADSRERHVVAEERHLVG